MRVLAIARSQNPRGGVCCTPEAAQGCWILPSPLGGEGLGGVGAASPRTPPLTPTPLPQGARGEANGPGSGRIAREKRLTRRQGKPSMEECSSVPAVKDPRVTMTRPRLRLVILFTLAVLLTAQGLVHSVSFAVFAARPTPCATASLPRCCPDCCRHDNVAPDHAAAVARDASSTSPLCPGCPGCPVNCCWCCAAKVPCCPPAGDVLPVIVACPEDRLAEASLCFPVPPLAELLQPPRG
jgi:hypothetical protein